MVMKLSRTNQRRVIVDELRKLKTHPTAEELYRLVRRRLPQISLGTVYRNLELLSEAGQIMKLEIGGRKRRFDGDITNHHHLRCKKCGMVEDIEVEGMEFIGESLSKSLDARITGWNIEFEGLCKRCSEKEESSFRHDACSRRQETEMAEAL